MEIIIIRTKRKTVSIQVNPDLSVTVRAPKRISNKEIDKILKEKEKWIKKHIEQIRKMNQSFDKLEWQPLTDEEIRELAEKAVEYITSRVEHYAKIIGVDYGRITIRNQKTRWGSCSSKGNLNFNCLLMLTPEDVIDYVVVHELCHRKEMNHSRIFWQEVGKIIPEYKKYEKWLKNEGSFIIRRARKDVLG